MRVRAKYSDCKHLDESSFKRIGYSSQTVISITSDAEYEVHAIIIFKGQVKLQILDDYSDPDRYSSEFFKVCDTNIPKDWIINTFPGEPKLVIGPYFFAKDLKSYSAMILTESPEIDLFWERVKNIKTERLHIEVLDKLKLVLDDKLSHKEVAYWANRFLDDESKQKIAEENTRDLIDILIGFETEKYDKTQIKELLDFYYTEPKY